MLRPFEADPTNVDSRKGPGSVELGAGSSHGGERIGWALNIVAVAVALFAWTLFSSPRTSTTFPTPQDVFAAAKQITVRGYAGGALLTHTLYSIKLALSGFFIAVAAAVPLGIAMALDRRIFAVVEPIVGVIRPIPPLAWVPIAIVWFGLGDAAMIFVVWFTAFVPSLINTYSGVSLRRSYSHRCRTCSWSKGHKAVAGSRHSRRAPNDFHWATCFPASGMDDISRRRTCRRILRFGPCAVDCSAGHLSRHDSCCHGVHSMCRGIDERSLECR